MNPPQATISSASPTSTTAALASNVPKEDEGSSGLPGAFPETPAAENQEFRVNPIPATPGLGNPITTRPGERVPQPSEFTNRTIESGVTLDKESYDKAGGVPQLPDVVTPAEERAAKGVDMFGLPEQTKSMIPESSLPIIGGASAGAGMADVGPTIQSAGPRTTTSELAGKVPLESQRVPDVVSESQEAANSSPEASANPEAVQEKSAVEQELVKKVPEEPATSESTIAGKAAAVATGAAATTAAAVTGAAAYASSGQATEDAKAKLPVSAQQTLDKVNGSTKETTPIASTVPDVVQESITESHQAPEAAASKAAVEEKSAVESELLRTIKTEQGSGEPAPTTTAALIEEAPKPLTKSTETPLASSVPTASTTDTNATPIVAKPTTPIVHEPMTANDNQKSTSTSEQGLAAPATAPATTPTTQQSMMGKRQESRDISPMTRGSEPSVTTGVASTRTPTKSTPAATGSTSTSTAAPGSPMSTNTNDSTETKKNKRKSGFFGKLKEKFEHRKDKN